MELYFDLMSPYSYLASTRVEPMVEAAGGEVVWRPCFLPGLLTATGNRGPAEIPAKASWVIKDLGDWTKALGLPPVTIPETFPFLAAQADRCALVAADEGKGGAFAKAAFVAIWRDGRDANDPAMLDEVLSSVGLEGPAVRARAASAELKARLRDETARAVERGAFGVPTFFVEDELFVGNDRLDFVVGAVRARGA